MFDFVTEVFSIAFSAALAYGDEDLLYPEDEDTFTPLLQSCTGEVANFSMTHPAHTLSVFT